MLTPIGEVAETIGGQDHEVAQDIFVIFDAFFGVLMLFLMLFWFFFTNFTHFLIEHNCNHFSPPFRSVTTHCWSNSTCVKIRLSRNLFFFSYHDICAVYGWYTNTAEKFPVDGFNFIASQLILNGAECIFCFRNLQ